MTAAAERGPAEATRTVFFGSGPFAVPILDALAAEPRLEIVGVVTAPDRPAGRHGRLTPAPVAARARELGLRLLQPTRVRAPESIAAIAELHPRLGILADYGQIVPQALIDVPTLGIVNVHPSLLPRHRGAAPIQATIAAGDPEAGVSLMQMDAGVDTGPVLAAESWPLAGAERAPDLEAEAARRGAALLRRVLPDLLAGRLHPVAQADAGATHTRPHRRADGRLDPGRPARELERLVRALTPWPGTFVETPAGRLLVHAASTASGRPGDVPGRLVEEDGRLALTTADGRLALDRVQLAGGKPLASGALLRGHPGLVGATIEVAERAE